MCRLVRTSRTRRQLHGLPSAEPLRAWQRLLSGWSIYAAATRASSFEHCGVAHCSRALRFFIRSARQRSGGAHLSGTGTTSLVNTPPRRARTGSHVRDRNSLNSCSAVAAPLH